jgi:uncharacterized Tic20 family protein
MQNTDPCVQSTGNSESSLAALVHLSGIFTLFVGPLIVYLNRGSRGAGTDRIRDAAREALNFQITLLLAWVATIISFAILIGFLMVPILGLVSIAMPVWAAVVESRGEAFRYPLVPRWLR